MFTNKDKLYLQTSDIPKFKNKIEQAIKLSKELASVLNDLETYSFEFEIKKEET